MIFEYWIYRCRMGADVQEQVPVKVKVKEEEEEEERVAV
jgi:hypothetical protein